MLVMGSVHCPGGGSENLHSSSLTALERLATPAKERTRPCCALYHQPSTLNPAAVLGYCQNPGLQRWGC